tara:strand:- start:148 stop:339 length:192 start_codon:yes stop_codon:yes gene_type:complete
MNRKINDTQAKRTEPLFSIDVRFVNAIQNHFGLSNFQMVLLSWCKGLWTGILFSLILHNFISH